MFHFKWGPGSVNLGNQGLKGTQLPVVWGLTESCDFGGEIWPEPQN